MYVCTYTVRIVLASGILLAFQFKCLDADTSTICTCVCVDLSVCLSVHLLHLNVIYGQAMAAMHLISYESDRALVGLLSWLEGGSSRLGLTAYVVLLQRRDLG